MPSMNLDDATQRRPTVKSHLNHRYHKILIEFLKYTPIPLGGEGKTALSLKITLKEEIESILKKNSDQTWGWSSRSEKSPSPPKDGL